MGINGIFFKIVKYCDISLIVRLMFTYDVTLQFVVIKLANLPRTP